MNFFALLKPISNIKITVKYNCINKKNFNYNLKLKIFLKDLQSMMKFGIRKGKFLFRISIFFTNRNFLTTPLLIHQSKQLTLIIHFNILVQSGCISSYSTKW